MVLLIIGASSTYAQEHYLQEEDEMLPMLEQLKPRMRRQVAIPQQPQQYQPTGGSQAGGNNFLGFLSDLGPQVDRVKQFSSIFSSVTGSGPQQAGSQQAPSSGASASQVLSQLSELMRSSQTRSSQALAGAPQQAQQVAQQGVLASQSAQSGLGAALMEMVQGLQRIAMNNPMLLPEVKNLYSSVSSRLSSTTNSLNNGQITPAKNADQLVDNLSKVALAPQSAWRDQLTAPPIEASESTNMMQTLSQFAIFLLLIDTL